MPKGMGYKDGYSKTAKAKDSKKVDIKKSRKAKEQMKGKK